MNAFFEQEVLGRSLTTEERDTINSLSSLVNGCGGGDLEVIAKAMVADHRTLVQAKASLFLQFFLVLAEQDYDLRNEAAVLLARKLKPIIDEATFGTGRLPGI